MKYKPSITTFVGKTHAYFAIENVDEASKDNDEVETIPSITEIILVMPRLKRKQDWKEERKNTHSVSWLFSDLHSILPL